MRDIFNFKCDPMTPLERDLKERRDHMNAMRELDEFKVCITNLIENYIKMIDMKIHSQDLKIDRTLKELTEDVIETSKSIVNTAMETGAVSIEPVYNPEVEMLSYAMRSVVPDTPVEPEEPEEPTTVTFTIDGSNYTPPVGTTWREWADSGSGSKQGYTTEAGGVVEVNYGQTVRTANGVKVDNTKEIESGDYYCTTFIFIENSGSRNIISFYGDPDFEGYTDTWGTFAEYTGWITFVTDDPSEFVRTVGSKEYVDANDTILAGVYEFTNEPPNDTKTFSVCVWYNENTSEYEYETYSTSKETWEEAIENGDLPSNYSIEGFRDMSYADEDGEGVYNSNGAFFIVDSNGYVGPTDNIIDGYTYEIG